MVRGVSALKALLRGGAEPVPPISRGGPRGAPKQMAQGAATAQAGSCQGRPCQGEIVGGPGTSYLDPRRSQEVLGSL